MAVYTQLDSDQLAALIAQAYDLGTFVSAEGIAEGVENSNYLLTMRDADGMQRYILTLYEKRVEAQDLPFFLGLMQHVARCGVACPAPVVRRDGALYGTMAGKHAAVVSFLPGKSCKLFLPSQVQQVGQVLAMLHQATENFVGTRANALALPGWEKLYAKTSGKLEVIAPGLEDLVRSELTFLQRHWPQDLMPRGVIHADLFPDNVFFDGDAVSGIIDFYFACTDALAYDVAITLNAWCFEADGNFNRDKSLALLAGYQQVRGLTAAEREALPILLRGAALRFLLTRAHDLIHHPAGALVTPHDPVEYMRKLQFHRQVADRSLYGVA